jgi:hypothetical protein
VKPVFLLGCYGCIFHDWEFDSALSKLRSFWGGVSRYATVLDHISTYKLNLIYSWGKRPLGRLKRRWEDNIKMELQEVGGVCGDWMELAQDSDSWRALKSTLKKVRVP